LKNQEDKKLDKQWYIELYKDFGDDYDNEPYTKGTKGEVDFILFLFGIITLPVGFIGKRFENKIKTMEVESTDPQIKERFERYLKQWNKPHLQLPD